MPYRRLVQISLVVLLVAAAAPLVIPGSASPTDSSLLISHECNAPEEDGWRPRWPRRPVVLRVPPWVPRPSWRPSAPLPPVGPRPVPRDVDGRPEGYETFGRLVMRVPHSQLPMRLFSNDPRADDSVRRALAAWNATARTLGVDSLFRQTWSPSEADFTVDWSGRGLGGRTVGMTRLSYGQSRARVVGVTLRPLESLRHTAPEVLAHELGHVLGLGHSGARGDLMYPLAHGYPGYVRISDRDQQMVMWLYSRSDYVPILLSRASPESFALHGTSGAPARPRVSAADVP